jgi:DUF1680 family protein
LAVSADQAERWTLGIRQPDWAVGPAFVTVDGASVTVVASKQGFIEVERTWKDACVRVSFP